ncbi:MAG: relaxase/mobilization nuclease domain-containing protein [Bdellovibrionota bacterium]
MAYVSIEWSKNAAAELKYVLKERGDRDVTSTSGCRVENAIDDFESVRQEHRNNGGNQALHIVQSFSSSDSQKLAPDEYNAIGKKLAEENFPGHQFVVRTHTDKTHIHNHIVLNTVSADTGRKIENKRSLIERLHRSSDKLCLEYGLSIINPEAHERGARLPRSVQQMVRHGKKSYIFDLVQKADVARSIATSFDEYRDTLSGFGIRTVIEAKNISYFYPGKERGKRGSKLGKDYDKSGLVEAFRSNDEKFAKNPTLKTQLLGQYEQIKKYGMQTTVSNPARKRGIAPATTSK